MPAPVTPPAIVEINIATTADGEPALITSRACREPGQGAARLREEPLPASRGLTEQPPVLLLEAPRAAGRMTSAAAAGRKSHAVPGRGRPRRHRRRQRRVQDPGRERGRSRRLLGVGGGRRQRRRHRRPDRRRSWQRQRRRLCRCGLCGVRQDRRLRQPGRPRRHRRRHRRLQDPGRERGRSSPAARCRRRATSTATASTT